MIKMRKHLALLLACLCLVFLIPHEAFADTCPHMSEEACVICDVEAQIEALPELDDMNGTHFEQFTAVCDTYDALEPEQQEQVGNAQKLLTIREAFSSSEADISTAATCTHGTSFTKTSGTLSSGNYYLTGNRSLSGTIYISSGTVNICLNGYTLKGNNSFKLFQVTDKATLNIYDCKGAGKITGGYQDDMYSPSGCLEAIGGYINMYGGTVTGNSAYAGGAVAVDAAGKFNMYGGVITGNTATMGGGIYTAGGSATIYDGTVTGNSASEGGGAYITMQGRLYMEGGAITGNTATTNGGGVYKDGGLLSLTYSPKINNNTVNGQSNNVYLYRGQTISPVYYIGFYPTSPIGVTTMAAPTSSSPVNITGSTDGDYSLYFFSDNSSYGVRSSNNIVQLYVITYRYVYYHANGGSGSMTAHSLADGRIAVIKSNTFTRPGYRFTGWNTAANGSGTSYSPGSTLNPTGNITLYAQWEAITDYTIVLPDGGNIVVDPNTRTGSAGIGIQAGSMIPENKSLQMSVNAGMHYSGAYRLQNQTGGQFTAYDLAYKGSPVDPGSPGGKTVLETAGSSSVFSGFENDISVVVDTAIASGVYTDTLTFSFAIV